MSAESPTSVTYSVVSPNGFPALLTVRDDKLSELLKKMGTTEKYLIDNKFTPQVKGYSNGTAPKQQPLPMEGEDTKLCTEHGVQMKGKDGKFGKFYSHAKQMDGEWVYCKGKGWGK